MGILPIGFFSPLPLAMMIPFMATQSLAMGEAFGKSFQYGKRKISSMSNEEFNKLTFHDLMVEQTANIKALVPELNKQMAQSQIMQSAIFKEMVNLIPTFFDSLFSALDPKHIEDPTKIIQASPSPEITNIRYFNERDQPDESEQLKELRALLEKSLEQQGTKESLAEKLNPPPPPTIIKAAPPDDAALARGQSLREDEAWRAWSSKLSGLKSTYNKLNQVIKNPTTSTSTQYRQAGTKNLGSVSSTERAHVVALLKNKKFSITSQIRAMSRDYRSPNNNIRQNALRLRANMSQYS